MNEQAQASAYNFSSLDAIIERGEPLVSAFKQAIAENNQQLDQRFIQGESIRALVKDRSDFFDALLARAWRCFVIGDRSLSLVAVGGYGRGELHPKSDIDLLVLSEHPLDDAQSEVISNFITLLWDLGLKVGHAVRTLSEAIEAARNDLTIITNVIESRTLAGDYSLLPSLLHSTRPEEMWPSDTYFEAKVSEQRQRHERNDNTEYNLEPNVKNAPGGLRDIQTIAWVAKRHFGEGDLTALHRRGLLTDMEYSLLKNGEAFLWRVRYGIHMLSKRPEERLQVDIQRELASIFGYEDNDQAMDVEQFMRRYYRWVSTLSQLNEVLLQYLQETIVPPATPPRVIKINRRFNRVDNLVETAHTQVFAQTPSAILEAFALMGENPGLLGLTPSTIRQLRAHLHLIDHRFRSDIRNTTLFMEIMRSPYDLSDILKKMTRYGVLGAYLPEYDHITGLMQHDLFHRYTVDAHTLILIKHLRRFYKGKDAETFPVATKVAKQLPKPELLFIAGLYHDIAKGRGGNHATKGAIYAAEFCERHHLGAWDTKLVSWLVEKHLLMSGVSQKQDLSDPEVIKRFAEKVEDQTYLDYLFCLTVADINATNPELWNSWKALLLRQLYHLTTEALEHGANKTNAAIWISDTQREARKLLNANGYTDATLDSLWARFDYEYFLQTDAATIAWQIEHIIKHDSDEPLVIVQDHSDAQAISATQVFVFSKDQSKLFAKITRSLNDLGLSVYDARIHSLSNGFVADSFMVLNRQKKTIGHDPIMVDKIVATIVSNISKQEQSSSIKTLKPHRLNKYFTEQTQVRTEVDSEKRFTILSVTTSDRIGLLANIAEALSELDINVCSARIATLGEKAQDIFHVTDLNGQAITDGDALNAIAQDIYTKIETFQAEHQ